MPFCLKLPNPEMFSFKKNLIVFSFDSIKHYGNGLVDGDGMNSKISHIFKETSRLVSLDVITDFAIQRGSLK
jgi:hypothetical protein